ncbi:uncharacterized protein BT62DRAFT_940783 [Guyanagaster necrorhizus]|uniref:Protein kinase domain-containing protein n=1 Tax=Guyanagaster necrorhizus TaxID=856835 RepID=A0A9P7W492_9AGAR|nr:uncharacterized protein BT62DRAFT_940783 [Guyanagaster necrorhizus MCA 3950]KAG7451829.1 hypothetical protein BT62DRAFT_940783 [Guyanagaster necrorhizus MCA 3950]
MLWVHHHSFLLESGFQLRPKFHPDWKPTWKSEREMIFSEEILGHGVLNPDIIDATRIQDGKLVVLKRIVKTEFPFEVELGTFFSSSPLSDNPRNHCVPVYEVLQSPYDPDDQMIVMPRLREMKTPSFDTVGEFVEAFRQIFEGVEFMHENFVAHKDINILNVMVDASKLYPKGFHPVYHFLDNDNIGFATHITRTQCWPRYHIIDFGYSCRYDPSELPFDHIVAAGDRSAPEMERIRADPSTRLNPFPFDVYCVANIMRKDYGIEFCPALEFLLPLVEDMTQDEPSLRPTMSEASARFVRLCNSLSTSQLRAFPGIDAAGLGHRCRRLKYTVTGVAPLPVKKFLEPDTVTNSRFRSFYTLTPGHVSGVTEMSPCP